MLNIKKLKSLPQFFVVLKWSFEYFKLFPQLLESLSFLIALWDLCEVSVFVLKKVGGVFAALWSNLCKFEIKWWWVDEMKLHWRGLQPIIHHIFMLFLFFLRNDPPQIFVFKSHFYVLYTTSKTPSLKWLRTVNI